MQMYVYIDTTTIKETSYICIYIYLSPIHLYIHTCISIHLYMPNCLQCLCELMRHVSELLSDGMRSGWNKLSELHDSQPLNWIHEEPCRCESTPTKLTIRAERCPLRHSMIEQHREAQTKAHAMTDALGERLIEGHRHDLTIVGKLVGDHCAEESRVSDEAGPIG